MNSQSNQSTINTATTTSAGTSTSPTTPATTATAVTIKKLTTEEYATTLKLLSDGGVFRQQQSKPPSKNDYDMYILQCPKCNFWHNPRDMVFPPPKVYTHSRICIHCLVKRCNPDARTLAEITTEQGRITMTNQVERMVARYNEILYDIYHHSKYSISAIVNECAAHNEDKVFFYNFSI